MTETLQEHWLEEAVQLHPPRGGVRYLIHLTRERCRHCSTGTRVVTVWATEQGQGEEVAWCGRCFNATTGRVSLGRHRRRYQEVREAVARGRVSPPWNAARHAVDDLQRRGLI